MFRMPVDYCMADDELVSFILRSKEKGRGREQIMRALLSVGWRKERIDAAFKKVSEMEDQIEEEDFGAGGKAKQTGPKGAPEPEKSEESSEASPQESGKSRGGAKEPERESRDIPEGAGPLSKPVKISPDVFSREKTVRSVRAEPDDEAQEKEGEEESQAEGGKTAAATGSAAAPAAKSSGETPGTSNPAFANLGKAVPAKNRVSISQIFILLALFAVCAAIIGSILFMTDFGESVRNKAINFVSELRGNQGPAATYVPVSSPSHQNGTQNQNVSPSEGGQPHSSQPAGAL